MNDLASTDSGGTLVVWRLAFDGAEEVQVQTLLCLTLHDPGNPPCGSHLVGRKLTDWGVVQAWML